MSLPGVIAPFRLARSGACVQGQVPLSDLRRLPGGAGGQGAEMAFECQFSVDAQGQAWLAASIDATVQLVCQRCLQPFVQCVEKRSRVALVAADSEQFSHLDGSEVLPVHDEHLDLLELLEDELLLVLPFAPLHPRGECAVAAEYRPVAVESGGAGPLAGLGDMLKGAGLTKKQP